MRILVAALAALLPQRLKHLVYRHAFGWEIDPTARLGVSLIVVDHAVIGAGVTMSHFNIFKGLTRLELGRGVAIGAFNWVSGPPLASGAFPNSPDRVPSLVMGPESALTNRHVVDCSDRVEFEPMAIMAGNRSQVLTHGIDIHHNLQRTEPVTIGERSVVFNGAILLAGCRVPPRCVVAAGAVVSDDLGEELTIYGGVPARAIKALPADNAYISRDKGLTP
jgi:acetyltransferase-like isoleucine patch superfamily enzyme